MGSAFQKYDRMVLSEEQFIRLSEQDFKQPTMAQKILKKKASKGRRTEFTDTGLGSVRGSLDNSSSLSLASSAGSIMSNTSSIRSVFSFNRRPRTSTSSSVSSITSNSSVGSVGSTTERVDKYGMTKDQWIPQMF